MQETSHWPTHRLNVMCQQRKSNWQHPNTYYGEREESQHSATNECDASRHPHPYRTLSTKAVQITADPGRDVILEAIHFLVEIGNPRHPRLSSRIRSFLLPSRRRDPRWHRMVETTSTPGNYVAGFNRNNSAKSRAPAGGKHHRTSMSAKWIFLVLSVWSMPDRSECAIQTAVMWGSVC
jgi:hypothetical protein